MAQREIATIVWHIQGHYIDVVYTSSEPERLIGSQDKAADLAQEAGLRLVPTTDGTVRWIRDAEAWWTP